MRFRNPAGCCNGSLRDNGKVSFLDSLENNLKTLETQEETGNHSRQREKDRGRALATAPWAERLKKEPYAQNLMREATVAGRERRMKVHLAWLDTALRLEARTLRLELRPTPEGIVAIFMNGDGATARQAVDLASDPRKLVDVWMAALDEQKRIDEAAIAAMDSEE